ncbi:MAG: ribonuclease HII [Chloroflexi bacterium]|nr:ribonuclease HII [Chloroflexota bacterium]
MRRDPNLLLEFELLSQGYRRIAGVDEAGRGSWAGAVVAAAVILPLEAETAQKLKGVRDSKQLSPAQRERCFDLVCQAALAVGVGVGSVGEIDSIGLGLANRLAMKLAIDDLPVEPDYLLIDALKLPDLKIPQRSIIKGDASSLSIAAASIVAKVTRDRMMWELDSAYPGYGFGRHKGYGTKLHRLALRALGPCPMHRHSYAPIRSLMAP